MSTSKTIENKLARIIQMIASNETDLENDRIALTKNPSFDPFQIFRDIDKQSKGYLNETDLALFLTNQKVFLQGKELQAVFSMKKDGTLKLTFQDFLHHVTPRSDNTLKNNVVNKIGKSEARSTYHTKGTVEDVERLIARIYKKESENIQQIENERYILASLGRAGLEESLALLADRNTGYLTFKTVALFLKEHHFDLSITDFESFVRRVDTSKKGRIDIEDFKYFLAPNDSQMTSNYSSIGRDNTRFDLGKSVVDSFSSPLRQLAAGGPSPFNIHIHETHHIPANISALSPHQHPHSPPPKLFSPGNKNFMSKIDLIQAQERQFDSRGTYQLEERRLSRHATGGSPPRQIITRTTTTYSPGRNERETATFFSGRIGSIRDNYQARPQTYNTSTNIDSIRRTYGLPENSARSRGQQDQAPLAYSTFLQKDLPPFSQAVQALSNIPSSRLGYNEYRSSSIQPRLPTAGDYQDLPGQRLSHQRLSHDRRQTTEGRETLSRSPMRNSRPSARLYEMKTPAYLQANLPPKHDIYAQDKGESLSRPSYTRPEIPLSYKGGAASRYLSNQNYASGGQIRSSSPGLSAVSGYASRLSGGYDSKQYSTAYGGSIRTNTAFANATEGMRREEPITSHIKAEPTRFSNVESQIESRRKARDNVANGGSGIKANITSSVSGIGGIRDNFTSSIGGVGSTSGALTREHLVGSGSGVKRETLASSIGGGVAGRISPNGHLAGSANKRDYVSIKEEPLTQEFSAGGIASSSIQDQIEKRQKARDGFPAGKDPSNLPSYTGTSPIRDPYRASSHLQTINETREGGLRYSPPRLDVDKKSSLGAYSTSYQINETAAYPYPKSATVQEPTSVVKTEGDQVGYSGSSYKFSNPRYEQLWSQ